MLCGARRFFVSGLFVEEENKLEKTVSRPALSTSMMMKISILGVLSFLLMYFEAPLPLFPGFLKIDLADLPSIVGGLALGPAAGVLIQLIKNLLKFILNTHTGGVGELANFFIGSSFVYILSVFYKYNKTKKGALIGCIIATLLMSVVGSLANYFVLIPFYAKIMPLDAIIAMGSSVNALIHDKLTLVLLGVFPFNILKGILLSLITALIYKKVSPILKGHE